MKKTTVCIDEDQERVLRLVAFQDRCSVEDVVGKALDEYLTRRGFPTSVQVSEPRHDIPFEEWRARFDAALERLRASVDANVTPEEIEAAITAASEELRQERLARRAAGGC